VASLITAILIIRSQRPRNRKIAALVFITLPVLNYVMALGTFGNASQYGMVLMSLIIMYCNIFYILHDTSSAVNRRRLSEVRELRFAIKNTIPIFFTYLFIGIAFGVLTVDAGYSVLLSVASAFFIYAGSMQLVMIPMMTSGASLIALALMTIFINARHIFYGISFVERFRKMGWRGVYMVLTLTDETYSILCSVQYEPGLDENRATFYIALLNHLYWIFGCLVGACAGRLLPFDMTGIDFSATAFFLVVVINQWRQYRTRLPFLTAATCALGFYLLLGKDYFLIPTLLACLIALLLLRRPIEAKEGREDA